jgi:hypothetical protein
VLRALNGVAVKFETLLPQSCDAAVLYLFDFTFGKRASETGYPLPPAGRGTLGESELRCYAGIAQKRISGMQSFSAWVRWIALGVFALLNSPLALKLLDPMAENIGLYDRDALPNAVSFLLGLAELTWVWAAALGVGVFAAGLWADWFLRRLDSTRAEARKKLGWEMVSLARSIADPPPAWSYMSPHEVGSEIMSAFIKAKQFGLWAPDLSVPTNVLEGLGPDQFRNILHSYLLLVGRMLNDGHFTEAKKVALEAKKGFDQALTKVQ